MRVLVSNDDGVDAPGIRFLAEGLRQAGHEVTVVAPDRDRSGASNSLTLDQPIRAKALGNEVYSVAGTPTDCVHLALAGMLAADPDIVRLGHQQHRQPRRRRDLFRHRRRRDGRSLPGPAGDRDVPGHRRPQGRSTSRRRRARRWKSPQRLLVDPLPADTILNVNVPDLPWSEVKGFEVTRLGHRHRAEPCIRQEDPRGRPIWWIGPAGPEQDAGPGTDFHAVRTGYISITPIHVDLTRYQALEKVASWVGGLSAALKDGA